jgi:predicted amino acid racemase
LDTPYLEVDLNKIRHNTKIIVSICRERGIDVLGVTKGVSGMPAVANAMIDAGVTGLADTRIRNIKKLKHAGITAPIMMLRLPRISSTGEIIKLTDMSMNSEFAMIKSLTAKSIKSGRKHGILLMIDVGDLREGVLHSRAMHWLDQILGLKDVQFYGIGTNVGCFGGVLPSKKNMGMLALIADNIRDAFGLNDFIVSVGGTNCLPLIENGDMPKQINQIRIGEGILLGRNSSMHDVLRGTYQDAFSLVAEIVEIKSKPSIPIGKIGSDAFGNTPSFVNRGIRRRALIALGKQDVRLSGLIPVDKGIKILGGSSDYIILDISDSQADYDLGDVVAFSLLYPGLLSVTTSPYISHVFKEEKS